MKIHVASILSLLAFALSSCDSILVEPTPYRHRPHTVSTYESVNDIVAKYPAWRLAEEGKFQEAHGYVERGEDTQAHYDMGRRYYEYWSVRTTKRTPSGKPDPNLGDELHDNNESTVSANEQKLAEMKRRAASGDQDAQQWVDQYQTRIKGARATQDEIERSRRQNQ